MIDNVWFVGVLNYYAAGLLGLRIGPVGLLSYWTIGLLCPPKVVGCRGGSRYFERACGFFKNMIVQKYQDSTPVKVRPKVSAPFRNCFWLNRISLCLNNFTTFKLPKFIKIPPPNKSLKTLGETNCFGPATFGKKQLEISSAFYVRSCQQFWKFWISQMLRYQTIMKQ